MRWVQGHRMVSACACMGMYVRVRVEVIVRAFASSSSMLGLRRLAASLDHALLPACLPAPSALASPCLQALSDEPLDVGMLHHQVLLAKVSQPASIPSWTASLYCLAGLPGCAAASLLLPAAPAATNTEHSHPPHPTPLPVLALQAGQKPLPQRGLQTPCEVQPSSPPEVRPV
jgi:hypothetical protein